MKTYYEWDYETVNQDGDIIDHNHRKELNQFTDQEKTDTLVLVRDKGHERSWAYVENGKLPDFFCDAYKRPTVKVPKRFHKELARQIFNN
jgi:hypothetical protein